MQQFEHIEGLQITLKHLVTYNTGCYLSHRQHIVQLEISMSPEKVQGRPYETSCNIFCNSSKQIDVYKSPENIELYTIQAVMCHTGDIPCNKSDQ